MLKPIVSNVHLDYFLLMRVIASYLVIRQHLVIERLFRGDYLFIGNPNSGGQAVVAFFMLSGYLITKVLLTKYKFSVSGLYSYYLGRIARIAPLYYFVTAFMLFFIFPYVVQSKTYLPELFKLLTFTYVGGLPYWNQVYWTISVEAMFYLMAPFFVVVYGYIFRNRLLAGLFPLVAIVGIFYSTIVNQLAIPDTLIVFSNWLGVFLLGASINGLIELLKQINGKTRTILRLSALIPLYISLVYPWYSFTEATSYVSWTMFSALLMFVFIIIIELTGGSQEKVERSVSPIKLASISLINHVGTISYAIFIIHMLLVTRINESFRPILAEKLPYSLSSLITLGFAIVLATLVGEFLYRSVEEPARGKLLSLFHLNQLNKLWTKNQSQK